MYIVNVESMDNVYSCSLEMGKFLSNRGFPILSVLNNSYYFSYTDNLRLALEILSIIDYEF